MSAGILMTAERIDILLNKHAKEEIATMEIAELRDLLKLDCLEINEFEMAKLALVNEYTDVFPSENGSDDTVGNWTIDSTQVSDFYSRTTGVTRVITDEGDYFYFTKDAIEEYKEELELANRCTVDDLIIRNQLNEFLGSRDLHPQLRKHLVSLKSPMSCVLHRGMSFPIHLLKIGESIYEWYGSSHWSKDFKVARGFASDGYISDDLEESLNEDKDLLKQYNVEHGYDLFKEVVFRLNTNTEAIDVHKLAIEFNLTDWIKEQEVTFIGTDFVITELQYIDIIGESPYYLVDVEEVPNTENGGI